MAPGTEKEERPTTEEVDDAFSDVTEAVDSGALDNEPKGTDGAGADDGEAGDAAAKPEAAAKSVEDDTDDELDAFAESLGGDRPRDDKGKFVKVEGTKPAESETKPAADGTKPAIDETKPADAGTTAGAAPQWKPLEVNAGDKDPARIEEALISETPTHMFLAIPKDKFPRFQSRMAKGIVGERVARQLQQERREFDALKAAPAPKSDAEIEAEIINEVMKPYLAQFLDERDLQILELRIKDAKNEARSTYATAEKERMAKATEAPWEEEQTTLLADQVYEVLKHPDLAGIDMAMVEDIYKTEMLPIRNSLIYKEGDGKFANQEWIYNRLKKAKAIGVQATPDAAKPAPSTEAAGKPATLPTTATKPAADAADRFNRGVDAAAKPRTTSVKANRDSRPATPRTRQDGDDARRPVLTPAMAAEDSVRQANRKWLNSDSLDFGGEDD